MKEPHLSQVGELKTSETIAHFVDGERTVLTSERRSSVYNPASGRVIGEVALASTTDVAKVVASAAEAFKAWEKTPPHVRARVLFRYRELVESNAGELARLINLEHGKVLSDARGEVTRGLEVVEFACGIPQMLKGECSENVGRGVDSVAIRQPLGVVAGITPFNFPAMVPMWMFPVAIACGNTFICKVSEKIPSTIMMLAELLREAGLPPGVFNVVHGDKEAVDALIDHPDVKAISFVGSTPIARYVYARATALGKRAQALGGAKNHMLIMPDADPQLTVDALLGAAYGSAGERCMAISVAVAVGEKTADSLIQSLAPRVRALKIGSGLATDDEMGALVTSAHRDRVRGYIDAGVQEGATLVVDGRNIKLQGYEDGFFLGGTLFDHVTPSMKIYKEEIFGPVLSVVRVSSFDEGIGLINNHEFGNGSWLRWGRLTGHPDCERSRCDSNRGGFRHGQRGILQIARRGRLYRPPRVHPLGQATALDRRCRPEGMDSSGASVRQEDVGYSRRTAQPADLRRASGRRHNPYIDILLRHRRHGRDLCRHHGLLCRG